MSDEKPDIVSKLNWAFYEFQDKVCGTAEPKFLFLGVDERAQFYQMVLDSASRKVFRVPREAHDNQYRGCPIIPVMKQSFLAFGL